VQEDSVDDVDDIVLPKGEDYKEQLMKYEDKDPGSLTILNQGNEGTLHLCEDDRNKSLWMTYAPCLGDDLVDAFQVLWMISWLDFH
jgi:hypothetical protein